MESAIEGRKDKRVRVNPGDLGRLCVNNVKYAIGKEKDGEAAVRLIILYAESLDTNYLIEILQEISFWLHAWDSTGAVMPHRSLWVDLYLTLVKDVDVRREEQKMAASATKAISPQGCHLLKSLYILFGQVWIAKDENGDVAIHHTKPKKDKEIGQWVSNHYVLIPDGYEVSKLVSWLDPEPLDVMAVLEANGMCEECMEQVGQHG